MKKKYYYLPFDFRTRDETLCLTANEKFQVVEIINKVIVFKSKAFQKKREMPIAVFKYFAMECE